MQRVLIFAIFGLPALAACSDFPDLDLALADFGQVAGFPVLIPIDPLLLTAANDAVDTEAQARIFAARVSQLRARARALQRPVIDRRTRRLMAAALQRHLQ